MDETGGVGGGLYVGDVDDGDERAVDDGSDEEGRGKEKLTGLAVGSGFKRDDGRRGVSCESIKTGPLGRGLFAPPTSRVLSRHGYRA